MAHRTPAELEEERRQILAAQRVPSEFAPIYERYVDQVFAYVLMLTRDREKASDLTAATFVKAVEELPRFQWRGLPYSAWLYRVAANLVARDSRRRGWIELPPHTAALDPDPGEVVEQRSEAEELRAAVAELPPDQRQAVMLRFGGDLRNAEIAQVMGRSEGAVKLLVFRGLTTLRRRFGAPLPAERRQDTAS